MDGQAGKRGLKRILWWGSALLAGAFLLFGAALAWEIYVAGNFHEVVKGEVYRSAQPSQAQLANWVGKYHIKTVINLRGTNTPDVRAEEAILKNLGVAYVSAELPIAHPPSSTELRRLIEATEKAQRPILFHCWRGADRSALASCIAAMALGGETFEEAEEQISLSYGHFSLRGYDVTGPAEMYEDWCSEQGRSPGGWSDFRAWAYGVYQDYAREGPGDKGVSEHQKASRDAWSPVGARMPIIPK